MKTIRQKVITYKIIKLQRKVFPSELSVKLLNVSPIYVMEAVDVNSRHCVEQQPDEEKK